MYVDIESIRAAAGVRRDPAAGIVLSEVPCRVAKHAREVL
jgi:hypothetical protein